MKSSSVVFIQDDRSKTVEREKNDLFKFISCVWFNTLIDVNPALTKCYFTRHSIHFPSFISSFFVFLIEQMNKSKTVFICPFSESLHVLNFKMTTNQTIRFWFFHFLHSQDDYLTHVRVFEMLKTIRRLDRKLMNEIWNFVVCIIQLSNLQWSIEVIFIWLPSECNLKMRQLFPLSLMIGRLKFIAFHFSIYESISMSKMTTKDRIRWLRQSQERNGTLRENEIREKELTQVNDQTCLSIFASTSFYSICINLLKR